MLILHNLAIFAMSISKSSAKSTGQGCRYSNTFFMISYQKYIRFIKKLTLQHCPGRNVQTFVNDTTKISLIMKNTYVLQKSSIFQAKIEMHTFSNGSKNLPLYINCIKNNINVKKYPIFCKYLILKSVKSVKNHLPMFDINSNLLTFIEII